MPSARSRKLQKRRKELEELSSTIHNNQPTSIDESEAIMKEKDALEDLSPTVHNNQSTPIDESKPIMTASLINELATALKGLQMTTPTQCHVKPPRYDGTQDVELFISRFQDVARLNRWTTEAHLLQLQLSLADKATDCSRGSSVPQVEELLRNRFGLSTRQARNKLRYMKRLPKQSIQEVGVEAERLTRLAYPDLRPQDQEEMMIEAFLEAIDNRAVRRHLLASPAYTLASTIAKTEEYLQIGDNSPSRVRAVEDESPLLDSLQATLKELQSTMAMQAETIKKLTEKKPLKCYDCNGPHPRRLCPLNKQNPQPGNA